MDIITPEQRSALMSRIRTKDTGIELTVRKGLHRAGLRYRLGGAGLKGRPDIVLPKYRAVIFVHGCFWHGHDCPLFRTPKSRSAFWKAKIEGNVQRDLRNIAQLQSEGWHVETVWECSLRGRTSAEQAAVCTELVSRLKKLPLR
jgi:DNA mismatch endonuclease (patch repair protein)